MIRLPFAIYKEDRSVNKDILSIFAFIILINIMKNKLCMDFFCFNLECYCKKLSVSFCSKIMPYGNSVTGFDFVAFGFNFILSLGRSEV